MPRVVRQSAELLRDAVGHYIFVSSVSVYAGFAEPVTEDSPLAELNDPETEDLGSGPSANYGGLKAACERVVEEIFPARSTLVRAGLIVGPYDPTGRFTYWPHRVARGGEVLVPGAPERLVQFIDVRDLASWILRAAAEGTAGPFIATSEPLPMQDVLDAAIAVTGSDASFTHVDEDMLVEREIGEWMELPLWISQADPEYRNFMAADTSKAKAAGLTTRSLEETVRGALEDAETVDGVGLMLEREAELLAAWHERAAA